MRSAYLPYVLSSGARDCKLRQLTNRRYLEDNLLLRVVRVLHFLKHRKIASDTRAAAGSVAFELVYCD